MSGESPGYQPEENFSRRDALLAGGVGIIQMLRKWLGFSEKSPEIALAEAEKLAEELEPVLLKEFEDKVAGKTGLNPKSPDYAKQSAAVLQEAQKLFLPAISAVDRKLIRQAGRQRRFSELGRSAIGGAVLGAITNEIIEKFHKDQNSDGKTISRREILIHLGTALGIGKFMTDNLRASAPASHLFFGKTADRYALAAATTILDRLQTLKWEREDHLKSSRSEMWVATLALMAKEKESLEQAFNCRSGLERYAAAYYLARRYNEASQSDDEA